MISKMKNSRDNAQDTGGVVGRLRAFASDNGPTLAPYQDHRGFAQHDRLRADLRALLDTLQPKSDSRPVSAAEDRAKELLSAAYWDAGFADAAAAFDQIGTAGWITESIAIRAIIAALTQPASDSK